MVDFFFDNFYEVLSGEGIWVLILIGSALAVASFILLTMKIEVNPKPNKLNNVIQTAKKEESPVQDKNKKKSKFKIIGRSRAKENADEEEAHIATETMPVRPEVVQPEHMEQVTVEMTDPDGFDIPSLPDIENQASPLTDNAMMSTEDTLQTEAGLSADTMEEDDIDQEEEEEEATDREESKEEENSEKAKGDSDSSSIFDIFNEVEEEDSGIAELAKNMEDVTINGLLSDTETLSEELKNIFSKFRRA
jgi:hypothetical protein